MFWFLSDNMKSETEYRSEQSSIQPNCTDTISITKESTIQKKSPKMQFRCDIDDCNKQFKDDIALRSHKLGRHLINEKKPKTVKSKKKPKKTVLCDFEGCNRRFKNATDLDRHKLVKHQSGATKKKEKVSKTKKSKTTATDKVQYDLEGFNLNPPPPAIKEPRAYYYAARSATFFR